MEHMDPDGRRIVTRTITTTTYSTEKSDAGETVIYETVHRRITRTVYVDDKVVEEVEEPAPQPTVTKKTAEQVAKLVNQSFELDDIELPEPKTEERLEETTDEQGRRIVTKILTTTTYEKESDGDGNILILEKVHRRIRRTIYIGDEIVEEIEEPDAMSTVQSPRQTQVARQTTTGWTKELKLPEPSTVEDIVEHTEADGRKVVTRTITTTTYSAETFENGDVIIYEKIERRIIRTVYMGDQVLEEVEEPPAEPIVTKKTADEILKVLEEGPEVADVSLPEAKTEEKTEERHGRSRQTNCHQDCHHHDV